MTNHHRLPDCPRCGDNRAVHADGERNFWCTFCKVIFDDSPDEGGDYSRDPVRSAILKEERERREAARKRAGKREGGTQ